MTAPLSDAQSEAELKAEPRAKKGWWHEAKQWIILILLVLGIHSFVAKPFYIPSESMLPTLLVGDRLIVTKYPYGFSYLSPTIKFLPPMKGRLFGHLPARGDIAVLKSTSDGNDWIKRVIGLPGDTVEVRDSVVYLNGKPLPRVRVADTVIRVSPNSDCVRFMEYRRAGADGAPECHYPTYRETLPDGRSYDTLDLEFTARDNFGPISIPDGKLFVMGDNRDNSEDSRVPPEIGGLGLVPVENLVGRAEFLTFSIDGSETLNPLSWWGALRRDRAFKSLRH